MKIEFNNKNFDRNLCISSLKVKKAQLRFDLEQFMAWAGLSDGAIILITPSQVVVADCLDLDPDYGYHAKAVDIIYNVIYKRLKRVSYYWCDKWQNSVVNDGNICIQLCSGSFNIISVPNIVSKLQYEALVFIFDRLKEIVLNKKYYFKYEGLEFLTFGLNETSYYIDNLNLLLEMVKSRVGYIEKKKEVIVGCDLSKLEFGLKKGTLLKRKVLVDDKRE